MKSMKLGLASVALVLGLTACPEIPGLGNGPEITSFTASPESIQAGESSTLTWSVDSTATSLTITPGVGDVTGQTSVSVTPSTTTEYTLTAVGNEGTSEESTTVTVSGTNPGSGGSGGQVPPPPPGEGPDGAFGVSTTEAGPFLSDVDGNITGNEDENIITVAPGDTFYAQVNYAAADGATIESVDIALVNRTPEGLAGTLGTTPVGGFTLGEPTSDCTLGSATYTCVYPITVGSDVEDIEDLDGAGGEFAYVFRTVVTDSTGADNGISNRGYVNIE